MPWTPSTSDLPVAAIFDTLQTALAAHRRAVLQAPPGSGKTTGVPLALRSAPWLGAGDILLLAPRRLAARAAAARMADLLGEPVGATVGYRVRMDTRVGPDTRIEVVTEGVLTRRLQQDPSLEGVGLVIFDEFHERSLEADLGLALCLELQGVLNRDLRLLVMSATLDSGPVAALLDAAPVITCAGQSFPVSTRFLGAHTPDGAVERVVATVLEAAAREHGNLLVFLPGAPEIRQVLQRLTRARLGPDWIVAPLFGNLSRSAQDRAIAPPPPGCRKIVLATAIAETSLTIEGIRVVVDAGLQRLPRFDVRSGMTRLTTVPVSRAAADQRRGRAGRTAPGVCLRLWSAHAHRSLPAANRPEILEADLTALALELAVWGADPAHLKWLDPPTAPALTAARSLLTALGALDDARRVTVQGRRMAELPVHPRLANMLLRAGNTAERRTACDLAALLGERDPLRFEAGFPDTDLRTRVDLLQALRAGHPLTVAGGLPDRAALRRCLRLSDDLHRRLNLRPGPAGDVAIGRLLAWAYPDRIAQQRPGQRGRFVLANGRGAFLDAHDVLAAEPYLVAAELDGQRRNARIYRAAAYRLEFLTAQFAERLRLQETVDWDAPRAAVRAQRIWRLDALTLRNEPLASPDPRLVTAALLEGVRRHGPACLPWTRALRSWQQRIGFLRRTADDTGPWPDVSDEALGRALEAWLGPFVGGLTRLRDLARVNLRAALESLLPYPLSRRLDDLAPTHLTVPSGSRLPIDYAGDVPVLAVRLQELFGLRQGPAVVAGRQPLLLHLLSPAGRPVQITQDLAGFWQNGYPQVKKELKGRYPKHFWPDDPLSAPATARVRPRRA